VSRPRLAHDGTYFVARGDTQRESPLTMIGIISTTGHPSVSGQQVLATALGKTLGIKGPALHELHDEDRLD
jgi:hypothetical protein